jgi:hypothetical protein
MFRWFHRKKWFQAGAIQLDAPALQLATLQQHRHRDGGI